ncbi:lipocalin family protein [Mesoflavibacter profundi]|uniref:lipocalin family protein n=1 Tax=Mesoflavibacter profundi TaxID=2708110 RepID=UPI00168ABC11|nr:lipocalin family protein [Mesoflavibacter profundi]
MQNLKHILLLISLITFFNCSKKKEDYTQYLNGYWEIKHVTLNNGTEKSYKINETVDYIQILNDSVGVRKKMKPKFDGTYSTTNFQEKFTFNLSENGLELNYKTPYYSWKETIQSISKSEMTVVNDNKDVYLYKRYQPIKLD